MALTKITPQMFDTSAAGHDFNIDNGTFVVDASTNRVGIGTATPSTLLDVNGALTATTIAGTLTTAAQTNITSVGTLTGLVVNGNASIQTGALTLSGANPPLSISNSGDAKVNFVRSSNTINYAMSSSASGGHGFYDNAASAYDLYMKAGNVGIGSTSPAAKLDVQIASAGIAQYVYNTGSNQAYINFANATTGKYTQAFGTPGGLLVGVDTDETSIVWNGSNTALRFGTNSTERMRIDSSGRVSFGPDAADIQIDPASTNSGNNLIYMRGNASNDKSSIQLNHYGVADYHIGVGHVGSGKFNIANDQTGNDFVIDTAGNVGINNTSPSHILDVHGANNTIIASLDHTGFSSRQVGLPGRFMVGPFGSGYPWAGYNFSHVGNTLTRLAGDYAWAISYGNNTKLSFNGAGNGSAGTALSWTELGYFDINGKFSPRQQIEVGVFSNSQTNIGEAWIGRAYDRQDGTLTIQLGGDNATSTRFEIVDRAWSKVISYISGEAPADSLYVTTGGDLHFGGYNQGRVKASGNSVFIDAIPASSHIIFRNNGSVEKMHITDTGSVYHPEQGSNGDYTSYIGSISNSGSGNRYAHVNISTAPGDMFWIEVIGYDYANSSGSIYGRSGGYIYLYTTQTAVYSSVLNGDIIQHYQLTNGTYEVVVDTKRTGTTNRWGSMVFRGGTDTITATQPLEIIQYSYTGTSAKVY